MMLTLEQLLKDISLDLVWKVLDSVMETFQFSSLHYPVLTTLETSLLCLIMYHQHQRIWVCHSCT